MLGHVELEAVTPFAVLVVEVDVTIAGVDLVRHGVIR